VPADRFLSGIDCHHFAKLTQVGTINASNLASNFEPDTAWRFKIGVLEGTKAHSCNIQNVDSHPM
jgi:hypothetical protein